MSAVIICSIGFVICSVGVVAALEQDPQWFVYTVVGISVTSLGLLAIGM